MSSKNKFEELVKMDLSRDKDKDLYDEYSETCLLLWSLTRGKVEKLRLLEKSMDKGKIYRLTIEEVTEEVTEVEDVGLEEIYETYEMEDKIKPIIKGGDLIEYLGVSPGKNMGQILKELFSLQLNGEFDDLKSGLKKAEELL